VGDPRSEAKLAGRHRVKKFTATVLAPVVAVLFGTPAFAADPTGRIDINTATAEQLKAIPEIGDRYAEKIIAARPYQKKDDLKDRNVIPADSFEKIKRLIDSVC
jgi:DNA uptake protein ComE-like DNA-binding protein